MTRRLVPVACLVLATSLLAPSATSQEGIVSTGATTWSLPSAFGGLDGVGSWFIGNDIVAGPTQTPTVYTYTQLSLFRNAGAAALAFTVTPEDKYLSLFVIGSALPSDTFTISYPWQAGRYYFPLLYLIQPGILAGYVYDLTEAVWTLVGVLPVSQEWGKFGSTTVTGASIQTPSGVCGQYGLSDHLRLAPYGFELGNVRTAERVTRSSGGPCPGVVTDFGVWERYRLGTAPA